MATHDDVFRRSCELRDAFWAEWGDVDPNVLAPIISPQFRGLPAWPTPRQSYRVVRRGSLTLVATDGISDPFDDPSRSGEQGFGLEVYAVTKELEEGQPVQSSWLFDLVTQVAMNAADHGGFREILEKSGLVSMQLFDVRVPGTWRDAEGSVGVLLNLQDSGPSGIRGELVLPIERTLMVNVKLLTQQELAFAVKNGAKGRVELGNRLLRSGEGQRSGTQRQSVI